MPRRMEMTLARLGVMDADRDILLPNCIGPAPVPTTLLQAHEWRQVPVGKALVREENGHLRATLDFNQTRAADDWWEAMRFDFKHTWTPPVAEFSFGFSVQEQETGMLEGQRARFIKSMRLHEVSSVVRGASVGSRMESLSDEKGRSGMERKVQRVDDDERAASPSLQRAIDARVKSILSRSPDAMVAPGAITDTDPTLQRLARRIALETEKQEIAAETHQRDMRQLQVRLRRLGVRI